MRLAANKITIVGNNFENTHRHTPKLSKKNKVELPEALLTTAERFVETELTTK